MIAEHQQERFIADPLFGTIDGMTEAILGVLNDKRNSTPEFDNIEGVEISLR
jgi:hypothetical protein